jgi:trimeric autotransporter adhesin
MKTQPRLLSITLTFICLLLLPRAHAVSPPPDGGYLHFTTAEGDHALDVLTSGLANTAIGWYSLSHATTGSYNTGVGAGALDLNDGDENTATGVGALLLNTTGANNTANGAFALMNTTMGTENTAIGDRALQNNTDGSFNDAHGANALFNSNGFGNNAFGDGALSNCVTGSFNTAVGDVAGNSVTGNGNVCIGAGMAGAPDVDNTTWIRNVYSSMASTRIVYVDSDNHVGTLASSRQFKEDIKPMQKASEAIMALKPVTFRYKKQFDASRTPMFGLVAEDVEKVDPSLVTRNAKGEAETVRYEAINVMLLNEFLKEHKAFVEEQHKVEKLDATVATLLATMKEQAAQIQKVNAQLELRKPASQTAANGP